MNATGNAIVKLDATPEIDQAKVLREKLRDASEVNRPGRVFFGSVLIISAVGLWLVPVQADDAAMRLIKLLVSVVLAVPGAMFIFSLRQRADLPDVQIDPARRELRILRRDRSRAVYVEATHRFDALSEITLQDRVLTARDAGGQVVLSVPLRDKTTEAALQEALKQVA